MVCRGANRTGHLRVAQPSHTSSPTCRRLPPDFALFPAAIGVWDHLAGDPHQKSRSLPVHSYRPSSPTSWGGGFKIVLSDTPIMGQVRTIWYKMWGDDET